jgi:hypothetical protein
VRLALFVLAFATAALVGTHGLAYWDAADYVRLAIDGGRSGLLLGRPLFLAVSRLVVAISGPHHAEPALRWFWTAVSSTAPPLLATLAVSLGLERRAALLAGVCLALSPSFAHTSHQVLTDGPALAASLAALILAARGRAVLAGVVLAIAIATRETAAVHAIAVVILLRRRAVVSLGITTALIGAAIVLLQPSLLHWGTAMKQSSQSHPLTLREVATSLGWIVAVGPVVVLGFARIHRAHPMVWPAAIATVLLVFYPDGSFSPRYMLATAPLLFLAAAPVLATRPRIAVAALVLPISLTKLATRHTDAIAARGAEAMRTFANPPPRALLVPGHYCAHVRLALAIEQRRDVALVCPGWDWPRDLTRTLDEAHRPLMLDLRADAWVGVREEPLRDAIAAYARERSAVGPIAVLSESR